jgi:hypothetical protein
MDADECWMSIYEAENENPLTLLAIFDKGSWHFGRIVRIGSAKWSK